jgi:hypothetical protein
MLWVGLSSETLNCLIFFFFSAFHGNHSITEQYHVFYLSYCLAELPRITSSSSDDREIVEGQENLMYTCEYEGSGDLEIAWFFNGQTIVPETGVSISENTLTIASPAVSNSGIYQCIVSNQFGDDQAAWLLEIRPQSKWAGHLHI